MPEYRLGSGMHNCVGAYRLGSGMHNCTGVCVCRWTKIQPSPIQQLFPTPPPSSTSWMTPAGLLSETPTTGSAGRRRPKTGSTPQPTSRSSRVESRTGWVESSLRQTQIEGWAQLRMGGRGTAMTWMVDLSKSRVFRETLYRLTREPTGIGPAAWSLPTPAK